MVKIIEKIFTARVLLVLNLIVLIAAELSGGWFETTGLIRCIAIVFVYLGVVRVFVHYKVYDRYLLPLVFTGLAALIILAVSNFLGVFSAQQEGVREGSTFINSVNLYIVCMFIMAAGIEFFVGRAKGRSSFLLWVLGGGAVVFAILGGLIYTEALPVSFATGGWVLGSYLLAVLLAFVLIGSRLTVIQHMVPIVARFTQNYMYAFFLLMFAAVVTILYRAFREFGLPEYHITYVSQFLFYCALSYMFLAFATLDNLPGVYQSIKRPPSPLQ